MPEGGVEGGWGGVDGTGIARALTSGADFHTNLMSSSSVKFTVIRNVVSGTSFPLDLVCLPPP